ncbi:MAG TPA: hypothetical protein PK113_06050, partial [Bacillota bacterium]|nr:hypothetical protein [Bacillota bacterium]
LSKNNMLFTHKNIHSLPRFIHCSILYLHRQALIIYQKRRTTSPVLELDEGFIQLSLTLQFTVVKWRVFQNDIEESSNKGLYDFESMNELFCQV